MSNGAYENPLLTISDRPLPQNIGVIGAGTIGPDIGYYLKSALSDLTLTLVDIDPKALENARARIEAYARKGVAKKKLSEKAAAAVVLNIVTTKNYADLAGCDWVLEAATENLELKRRIFTQVEAVVGPEVLITSNTSSLPASRLFGHLQHPERTTVTHFFAPAFRNPAVEVVRWAEGDPAVVEYLRRLFAATGKVPLVTADALCFMLDRVFDNWCNEAALLLDTCTAAEIDAVAGKFVHAGPFFVLNLAHGNPIIVETNTLQMEEGAHYRPADILKSVETWKTLRPGQRIEVDPDKSARIRDRLLGVLFSQSFDILDRNIGSCADLDLGCVTALGYKAGPLELMETLGDDQVSRIMSRFIADRPGMPGPTRPIAEYRSFRRHVLIDDLDGIKLLTLRRPQAMNALDDRVTDELLAAIREFEDDPQVKGFILTGYGNRAFCAGADIGRFPEVLGDADKSARYARDCSRLLVHLDRMSKPVVAALNGIALGGGLELALRCRGIVAVQDAWMQFPEITLGIVPGIGGMVVPYRRWPRAAETFHGMLCRAEKLAAGRALELGVLDGLARDFPELIALAAARVDALTGAGPTRSGSAPAPATRLDGPVRGTPPPPPLAEPKAANGMPLSAEVTGILQDAIQEAAAKATLAEALEAGYRAFGKSACTAAAAEGIQAFGEGRKPDFTRSG